MAMSKKENIEKLIMIVKQHPILYDMTLSEFKDSRKKDYIWDNTISHEMNGEKGDVLKTKWKNLRDSYQKYLRANATSTGQAAGASKGKNIDQYKSWSWAKNLEFLKPHLCFAATVSNVTENATERSSTEDLEIDQAPINEEDNLTENNSSRRNMPKPNQRKHESTTTSNIDKVLEHLNKKQKITFSALKSVELLMLSHAKTIKTFSSRRQALAKKQISDIVTNLEMEQINENEYASYEHPYHPSASHYHDDNVVNLSIENNSLVDL